MSDDDALESRLDRDIAEYEQKCAQTESQLAILELRHGSLQTELDALLGLRTKVTQRMDAMNRMAINVRLALSDGCDGRRRRWRPWRGWWRPTNTRWQMRKRIARNASVLRAI
jgi:hypothetical protein